MLDSMGKTEEWGPNPHPSLTHPHIKEQVAEQGDLESGTSLGVACRAGVPGAQGRCGGDLEEGMGSTEGAEGDQQ